MNKLNSNLSGGMNSHTSPLIIKDSEAELIVNYNLDKIGSLTRRNGYENFTATGLFQTLGLFGTMNPNKKSKAAYLSSNDNVLASATKRITYYWKSSDDTWATTDDDAQTKFDSNGAANEVFMTRFTSFLNYIFRVNGGDAPKSFLITTPQTATTVNLTEDDGSTPITITPSLIESFQNKLYCNRIADGYRNRIYYTTSGTSGGTVKWDTTNKWFDVNPDDGDLITALKNDGKNLLIFKTNSIYRIANNSLLEYGDKMIGVGTPSQESVQTHLETGITFFAHPKGIFAYNGGRPKLISKKIQEYIDAVSSWTYVAGGIDQDHYYLSVGDLTVGGKTISNAVLVYHISLDAWTIYSLAVNATVFTEIQSTYPVKQLVFGSNVAGYGNTYKFTTSTSDIYGSSTVKSIPAEVIFKEHLLSYPERTNISCIDIFADQRVESNVFYDLDRKNDFIPIGSLQDRITNFSRIPERECNSIRIKVADNSKDISVLSGYNIEHEPKNKRDENTYKTKRRANI